jgi:hypothetical protein
LRWRSREASLRSNSRTPVSCSASTWFRSFLCSLMACSGMASSVVLLSALASEPALLRTTIASATSTKVGRSAGRSAHMRCSSAHSVSGHLPGRFSSSPPQTRSLTASPLIAIIPEQTCASIFSLCGNVTWPSCSSRNWSSEPCCANSGIAAARGLQCRDRGTSRGPDAVRASRSSSPPPRMSHPCACAIQRSAQGAPGACSGGPT